MCSFVTFEQLCDDRYELHVPSRTRVAPEIVVPCCAPSCSFAWACMLARARGLKYLRTLHTRRLAGRGLKKNTKNARGGGMSLILSPRYRPPGTSWCFYTFGASFFCRRITSVLVHSPRLSHALHQERQLCRILNYSFTNILIVVSCSVL